MGSVTPPYRLTVSTSSSWFHEYYEAEVVREVSGFHTYRIHVPGWFALKMHRQPVHVGGCHAADAPDHSPELLIQVWLSRGELRHHRGHIGSGLTIRRNTILPFSAVPRTQSV